MAACVAPNPLETASWIYTNQRSFSSQGRGEDLSKRAEYLSPNLYTLLRAQWKCEDIKPGLCGLANDDPWVNSNGGEELSPVEFELVYSAPSKATVRMSYRFAFNGPNDPKATPGVTKLEFIKKTKSGCWLLDDLIGREGRSLKQQLTSVANP